MKTKISILNACFNHDCIRKDDTYNMSYIPIICRKWTRNHAFSVVQIGKQVR